MSNIFKNINIGYEINSTYISNISGLNQVKGIHPIKNEKGSIECVAILCTINGKSYPNEWIEEDNILKYYFYGITVNGSKKFSLDYKDNKAIINSKGNYPLYAFVRNSQSEKFKFKGEFKLIDIGSDIDGAMYFILSKDSNGDFRITDIPLSENENFPEGRLKERLHKYKERNPKVIKEAKLNFLNKHGRLYCEICGFDFEKVYGDIGKEYIEGHHTKPVSELKEDDYTNINDIILICSNCHRMLHRKRPCLSKEELVKLLK